MQWAMRTKVNSPRYLQKHTVCRRWSSDGCRSECRFPQSLFSIFFSTSFQEFYVADALVCLRYCAAQGMHQK